MAFEEAFGIEIPDDEADRMQRVSDAIAYSESHVASGRTRQPQGRAADLLTGNARSSVRRGGMTKAQKLRTLLAIVECAPAVRAMTVFESAARRGDLAALWDRYAGCIGEVKTRWEAEGRIERRGLLGDDRAGDAGRA